MEAHLLFEKNNEYNNSLLILHVIDYQREKERRTTSNTVNEQFKVVCVCVCVDVDNGIASANWTSNMPMSRTTIEQPYLTDQSYTNIRCSYRENDLYCTAEEWWTFNYQSIPYHITSINLISSSMKRSVFFVFLSLHVMWIIHSLFFIYCILIHAATCHACQSYPWVDK
jgi:hypothetical protein